MPYAAPFHRLVLIGSLYTDTFNTTLSMIPSGGGTLGPVTQGLADAVRASVASWFNKNLGTGTGAGCAFSVAAALTSIKLNRIGTDGRYMDADAIESVLPTPVTGFSTELVPPQLSIAATFRGANPRALAGRGRMFLPPSAVCTTIGSDGRILTAEAESYGEGVLNLVQGIRAVYNAQSVSAVVGIASNRGAGAFQPLTDITIGRTVDTIRSRRNKIPEDFVEIGV